MAFPRWLPLVAVVLLAGCGGGSKSNVRDAAGCLPVTAPPTKARTESKPSALLDATKTYEVTIATNCGSFTFKIDQKQSPNNAASFVSLAQHGFFDKTVFHRIVPGFVIQGGDPTASGNGGPGYTVVDTPPASAAYTHGVVAMAKTGAQAAGTGGSQFFVVTVPNAGLTADYAIIGTVVKGLAVADRIGQLGDANEQPTETVEIEHATVSIT